MPHLMAGLPKRVNKIHFASYVGCNVRGKPTELCRGGQFIGCAFAFDLDTTSTLYVMGLVPSERSYRLIAPFKDEVK
jgi:hypothetical protein